jgi:hypothetical protein
MPEYIENRPTVEAVNRLTAQVKRIADELEKLNGAFDKHSVVDRIASALEGLERR